MKKSGVVEEVWKRRAGFFISFAFFFLFISSSLLLTATHSCASLCHFARAKLLNFEDFQFLHTPALEALREPGVPHALR